MAKALKNARSTSRGVFDKIQQVLAENGAKKVMMDYAPDGTLEAIAFAVEINGKLAGFRLPANVDKVFNVMYPQATEERNERYLPAWRKQSYQTAWANIRDWVDAQMALVRTDQADIGQVFLPYMVMKNDRTLYEHVISDPKFLLE